MEQEIQARGQLETAKAHLNRLMGDPLNNVIGQTTPLEPREISVPSETGLLMEQKQRRPDFQNLLTELRAAPRGEIKIRVTFEIDTDGILGVAARNEETGEAQTTSIVLTGGMDDEKVEELVQKYSDE